MSGKFFKKIIASLMLVSLFVLPVFNIVSTAQAQYVNNSSFYTQGSNSSQSSVGDYMKIVGPKIPTLPGCSDLVKSGIKSGISDIKDIFSSGDSTSSSDGSDVITETGDDGSSSASNPEEGGFFAEAGGGDPYVSANNADATDAASAQAQSIEVDSPNANKQLQAGDKTATESKDAITAEASSQLCLNSIGKMIGKLLVQKLTQSTINWINTGNFGDSFFPKNTSQYFNNIAKNEILQLGTEISDPTKYPFGQGFMQGAATASKSTFSQNAQYSLNQMIQSTTPQFSDKSFSTDFSAGGWNAWDAMTQNPANNIVGFNLMASNELDNRLQGTSQSTAQDARAALQASGGYLGDQRCVVNGQVTTLTPQAETAALSAGNTSGTCKGQGGSWQYVTPGKMIADSATKLTDYQSNQYLSINDLNTAIAAILDAALNKYGGTLMTTGLTGLGQSNNQIDTTEAYEPNSGQTQNNIPAGYNYDGSWFQDHPNFDITKDLNEALIDDQRTYVDKLTDYDNNLVQLIMWIHQLDYCIPGPNPDWEGQASTALQGLGSVPIPGTNGWQTAAKIASYGSLASAIPIPGVATGIAIGSQIISGVLGAIGQSDSSSEAETAAGNTAGNILGLTFGGQTSMKDTQGVKQLLNNVFNSYVSKINLIYFSGKPASWPSNKPFFMPEATTEAASLFENIPGYQQIIDDNTKEIVFYQDLTQRLESLKSTMDNIIATGSSTDIANLQDPNSDIVKEFARLSTNLKNGDDIAQAANLANGASDDIKHVHDDLLTGPYGCEKELENIYKNDPIEYSAFVRRQPYPFPIFYTYTDAGWATSPSSAPGGGGYPWDDPYYYADIGNGTGTPSLTDKPQWSGTWNPQCVGLNGLQNHSSGWPAIAGCPGSNEGFGAPLDYVTFHDASDDDPSHGSECAESNEFEGDFNPPGDRSITLSLPGPDGDVPLTNPPNGDYCPGVVPRGLERALNIY